MKIKKITCKEVADYICETLAEDINSPHCVEIKEHLEHCVVCSGYFKSVNDTIAFYKNYNVEPTDECHERLMKYLNLDNNPKK